MRTTTSNSGLRLAARVAALAGCVLAVAVCGEQGRFATTSPTGGSGVGNGVVTVQAPSKTATIPVAVGDSVFVQVKLSDTHGITSLVLSGASVRGVPSLGTDTTVTRFTSRSVTLANVQDTTITRYLRAVLTDSTAEFVTITATAIDAANDTSKDTSLVQIVNGPKVSVLQPAESAVTAIGKYVGIQVRGIHPEGVKVLGWRATGVVKATSDSAIYGPVNGAMKDTVIFTDSLLIPTGTAAGSVVITPFGTDSLNDPSGIAPGVTVLVQTVVGDTTAPLVRDTMPLRVEVGDSLTVTATDPSGITKLGFLVKDTAGTVLHGDSVTFTGASTNATRRFRLGLDTITTFPRVVIVEAFGVDGATPANRGGSTITGTPKKSPAADKDTLTVVAGTTIAFPQGGQFGDAIMNPNRNELYLTNTLLDQVEVFQLNTNSFAAPIRVGSQPVGIALWPRDTLGNNRDTIIVANSGGTNLSLVNVATSPQEFQRHTLPNYIVSTVTTQPTPAGGIQILYTPYDLSDRPQYVGATCRHLTAGVCDSVLAVYSTTPTPAETGPFANHGYLAWENLTAPESATSGHFFWELGQLGTDTVEITAVRDTVQGQPLRYTILGAGIGELIDLPTLAFQESTFVRNSGDFNHAVIGEGGLNQGFARALMYDARVLLTVVSAPPCPLKSPTTDSIIGLLDCTMVRDNGVSSGIFISDFLVNRASKVLSVATNFNGRTNLVRADSIYAFDGVLKQAGLFQVGGTNPGMDFDPNNSFDATTKTSGTLNKNDRLAFAARPDAFIDVFDEYWYQQVATIPIRDTIIGPMRVASTGGVLVLVGVTSRGLVVVRLPNFVNPYPVRQPPGAVKQPVRVLLSTPIRSGGRP